MKRIPVIKIVRDRTVAYEAETKAVGSPDSASAIIREVIGDSIVENFVVLCLDRKHKVISAEIVSVGTIDQCLVHPREVYKAAVMTSAAAVIVGHNHPSGDPTPSPEDISLTRRLLEAGEILGIELLDHVVIGEHSYRSLREGTSIWHG